MATLTDTECRCLKCGQLLAFGSDRCINVHCPIGAANWEDLLNYWAYLSRMAYGSYREHADANNPDHIAEMGW